MHPTAAGDTRQTLLEASTHARPAHRCRAQQHRSRLTPDTTRNSQFAKKSSWTHVDVCVWGVHISTERHLHPRSETSTERDLHPRSETSAYAAKVAQAASRQTSETVLKFHASALPVPPRAYSAVDDLPERSTNALHPDLTKAAKDRCGAGYLLPAC